MASSHLLFLLAGWTFFDGVFSSSSYISEWTSAGTRMNKPTCVDIPENLTLCHGIGYTQMRLPNLLDHDSMSEVSQQAISWVPLFNLKCHPDTQLFLCSLFSPVCLDRPIYPCRSLCEAVKRGCEGRMSTYGFPWPDMVRCDKFPYDNDMCITIQSQDSGETTPCTACNQAETYENIIDNFCRADFVIKTKIKKVQKAKLSCKKARILKLRDGNLKKDLRRPTLKYANVTECCSSLSKGGNKKNRVLIMGNNKNGEGLVPTFIMEWRKSQAFKSAIRMMKKIDCNDPKIISETMLADGILSSDRKRRNGGHLRRRKKHQRNKHEHKGNIENKPTTLAA
ncbi:secreted frizzled-related protein 5-like [Centruroides vittatus]|uniref:secreted frizzled-related protein 5-like n=1 Tax=Centruroides vittatus TaxID=120091 RepID=UPI00350FF5B4